MRLIDAETITYGGNAKEIDGELYIKVDDVEKWLKNAPTAYDVKSVEKQIHEYFKGEVDSLNGDEPWEILKHNKAVCEIVKGGAM